MKKVDTSLKVIIVAIILSASCIKLTAGRLDPSRFAAFGGQQEVTAQKSMEQARIDRSKALAQAEATQRAEAQAEHEKESLLTAMDRKSKRLWERITNYTDSDEASDQQAIIDRMKHMDSEQAHDFYRDITNVIIELEAMTAQVKARLGSFETNSYGWGPEWRLEKAKKIKPAIASYLQERFNQQRTATPESRYTPTEEGFSSVEGTSMGDSMGGSDDLDDLIGSLDDEDL